MKAINHLLIFTCLLYIFISSALVSCSSKGNSSDKEISFKVYGNCEMCKETIEKSVQDVASTATWNKDSKVITVKYDSTKVRPEEIHSKIAAAGYDTELSKGDDASYNKLPECCQYERKK